MKPAKAADADARFVLAQLGEEPEAKAVRAKAKRAAKVGRGQRILLLSLSLLFGGCHFFASNHAALLAMLARRCDDDTGGSGSGGGGGCDCCCWW